MLYASVGFMYNISSNDLDDSHVVAEEPNQSFFDRCAHLWGSPTIKSTPNRALNGTQASTVENIIDSGGRKETNDDEPGVILRNKLELNLKETDANLRSPDVHFVEATKPSQSAIYFKVLFLACVVTLLYKQMLVFCLLLVPILVHIAGRAIDVFGIKDYAGEKWNEVKHILAEWIYPRQTALLPLCLPGVIQLNDKVHRYVRIAIRESIDTASSIIVIILLILVVIFAGVFCAVEIYSETITIVQLGSDVVNYTINHRPELMDMFPEGMQDSMDNVIENAYQYGRSGIETYIDEFLKDADKEQKRKLKEQVLSIWDRLIQYWVDKQKGNTHGPSVPSEAITDSIGQIVANEGKTSWHFLVALHGFRCAYFVIYAFIVLNTILAIALIVLPI